MKNTGYFHRQTKEILRSHKYSALIGLPVPTKCYRFEEYNNISLYSIDNVEDIRNEILDFHKVGIYTITYYSNDWTVKFFEKKPINDNIKLYTKLKFVDSIEEFDITDIAQDYLKANKDLSKLNTQFTFKISDVTTLFIATKIYLLSAQPNDVKTFYFYGLHPPNKIKCPIFLLDNSFLI